MRQVGSDTSATGNLSRSIAPAVTTTEVGEMHEGLVLESPMVPIEQSLIDAYAELCGDRNPIHLDPDYAKKCGLKNTIAHGALVLSKALGLAYELGCFQKTGTQFTEAHLKFKNPVYAGDRIGLRLTIVKFKELRHGYVRIVAEVKVVNDKGTVVHQYEWHGFFNKQCGNAA